MSKIYDSVIEYPGWFPNDGGNCRLRVYEKDNHITVIVSELILPDGDFEQDGVSITNAAEKVATVIRTEIGFIWDTYVEHYPLRGKFEDFEETFDFVEFTWTGTEYRTPRWEHAYKECVEACICEELEPMGKVKK